eukprot:CAMPEP_0171005420 /NCGR_PEP_ID=MMETSP0736-20130129/18350_1 /TAXON_ID=186038 /ORGANISM="Fragilariopsis kerguelensis, Strain L26-C5" /LENGTH=214 /DNA_ID=CAMNT_0011435109 /DNA_START=87 /DNA_END=728 /DNA_ORIENTATION=-
MTPTTTTTTRPRSHDRKRIKHSTSMPIQDSYRRSSGFRYSSINNSGSSLNSILEVDHHDRREEEAPFTSSSRLSRSRSSSTPLSFTLTQSLSSPTTVIAHTDFWHSTRTMKKTQTCTSLNGLLDIVPMTMDDDEEDEIDEDFDNYDTKSKMEVDDDDDLHNTVSVTSSIRDTSISSFSSSSSNNSSNQEEADGDRYFFFEDDDNNENDDDNCEW